MTRVVIAMMALTALLASHFPLTGGFVASLPRTRYRSDRSHGHHGGGCRADGQGLPLSTRRRNLGWLNTQRYIGGNMESSSTSEDYERNKEELKESDCYMPDVRFIDPVTSFQGAEFYRGNLDMLAGRNLIGNILFKDARIDLHSITEPGPYRLRTRWTLEVCFKALPWKPVTRFSGISEYTLSPEAKVVCQNDFWDSINLMEGGMYKAVATVDGVKDFVGQLRPNKGDKAGMLSDEEALLRRAQDYTVVRSKDGQVVAHREFQGAATDQRVRENSNLLMASLAADRLVAAGKEAEINLSARRMVKKGGILFFGGGEVEVNEVCIPLVDHDWTSGGRT